MKINPHRSRIQLQLKPNDTLQISAENNSLGKIRHSFPICNVAFKGAMTPEQYVSNLHERIAGL